MELFVLFNKGGLVMYLILLASIISLTIGFERWQHYRKAVTDMTFLKNELPCKLLANDFEGATMVCNEAGGSAAEVLKMGLEHRNLPGRQSDILAGAAIYQADSLKKYLSYLSIIVTMSPLLGLLGTVTGMIQSFSVLSIASGQPFAITEGVGEALIATASGLLVAILALIIHTILNNKYNNIVSDMEYAVTLYLTAIDGGKHEKTLTEK